MFSRIPASTDFHSEKGFGGTQGMPRSVDTSEKTLRANYGRTMNKGNMLIAESAQRMFRIDRKQSAHVANHVVDRALKNGTLRDIYSQFDFVVFSVANMVAPNWNHENFLTMVRELDLPFAVLSGGLQSDPAIWKSDLPAASMDLFREFNAKAKLFSVRGKETESWMSERGINATALGCPSNYLYPENVLRGKPVAKGQGPKILTAGYLATPSPRATRLLDMFDGRDADYVIQEEFFHSRADIPLPDHIFNDATGEVDKEFVDDLILKIHGRPSPFARYWYFQSPDQWRSRAATFNCFIGDRFHGGVASMQSGIPAVVIHKDLRVREMSALTGMPAISYDEFLAKDLDTIIDEQLSEARLESFKRQYAGAFLRFRDATAAAGLTLDATDEKIARIAAYAG